MQVTSTEPSRRSPIGALALQMGRDTVYVVAGYGLALASFVVLLTMLMTSVGLMITLIGFPLAVLALYVARGFAIAERALLRHVLGRRVGLHRPRYRRVTGRGIRGTLAPLVDPQCWLDMLHGIVAFVLALPAFVITVTWWALTLGNLTYPIWAWSLPDDEASGNLMEQLFGTNHPALHGLLHIAIGIFALGTLPWVLRGCVLLRAGLARALLASETLNQEITELTERRDAAVSAEASALRRLERDIHDGPQQRLVRLAMDLGRVQQRMDTDPKEAREMVSEALTQTKETLVELRALSLGIAPPILADRGLPSALTAVASRSIVPVDLEVGLSNGQRLPAEVENAAYFIASESLTNVAKHSRATRCVLSVAEVHGRLVILVEDDGIGGAEMAKGHGLDGLADRVRALGGKLTVISPTGGPTQILAELPVRA